MLSIRYPDQIHSQHRCVKRTLKATSENYLMYNEDWKERMPKKNVDNDLEKELAYCKEVERIVEKEQSISSIPAVQEKLNILKETVEDIQENITLSKDEDAK